MQCVGNRGSPVSCPVAMATEGVRQNDIEFTGKFLEIKRRLFGIKPLVGIKLIKRHFFRSFQRLVLLF